MERQKQYEETGDRIKRVREEQGLSYAEFGKEIGITKSMAYNLESGRVAAKESVLRLISYRFLVRLDFLINGNEPIYEVSKGLDDYLREQKATQEEIDWIYSLFALPENARKRTMQRVSAYMKGLECLMRKADGGEEDRKKEKEGELS